MRAALALPERHAVAVCGDGDFLMNGQEVATLVAQGGRGVRLDSNNEISEAVADVLAFDGPALLHLVIDPDTPSPSGEGY